MDSIDYLIVGSGIAGLSMAEFLEFNNQKFILVNQYLDGNASRQSSGVINPITGKEEAVSFGVRRIKAVLQ